MELEKLEATIEAVLFAMGNAVSVEKIATAIGHDTETTRKLVHETYTKDDDGNIVLNSDIYYNGINPGAEKQLNVDYGFGNGVFAYGGSKELQYSKFSDGEKEWNERVNASKEDIQLKPPILADEMQKEEMNLVTKFMRENFCIS